MPFSQESLEVASKQSAEAVQAAIEQDTTSAEDRVKNAREAFELSRKSTALNAEEKKRIVEASRMVIQAALESITAELRSAADVKLESLQQSQQINAKAKERLLQEQVTKFTEAKQEVLALQRSMESSFQESGTNAGREVLNDLKQAELTTMLKYGAAATGGLYVGNKIVETITNLRIFKFLFGTQEKPTLLRRAFTWAGRVTGALAGAVGLRMLSDRLPSFPSLPKVPTAEDVGKSLWNSTVGAVMPSAKFESPDGDKEASKETLTPQQKLEALVKEGKHAEALMHAIRNGGGLEIDEEGNARLNVEGGAPIEVTGALAALKKFAEDPIESAAGMDWVTLWTASGALYLVSRATLGKILYGKDLMPKTWKGKAFSVAKAALGPLPAIRDAGRHAGYAFRPRGGEQWWARFASQSLPARSVRNFQNWSARQWFQSDISTERGLLKTIKRRMFMKNIVELLELSSDKGPDGKPVPGSELEKASAELKYLDGRVKAGLTVMEGKLNKGQKIADEKLAAMTKVRERHADYDQNMQDLFGHHPEDENADEDLGSETEAQANEKMRADAEKEAEAEVKATETKQRVDAAKQKELSVTQQRVTELENDLEHQLKEAADAREVQAQTEEKLTTMREQSAAMTTRLQSLEQDATKNSQEIEGLRQTQQQTNEKIAALERSAEDATKRMESVTRELESTKQQLEGERSKFEKELQAERDAQAKLKEEIERLKTDLATERVNSEISSAEDEDARGRLQKNIEDKTERLRELQQQYTDAVTKAEAEAKAHAEEVARLKAQVKEGATATEAKAQLEEELKIARGRLAVLTEQLELARAQNKEGKTVAEAKAKLEEELGVARGRLASLTQQLELLKEQKKEGTAAVEEKAKLEEELRIARGRLASLTEQLDATRDENRRLKQDGEPKGDAGKGPAEGDVGAEAKAPKRLGPDASAAAAEPTTPRVKPPKEDALTTEPRNSGSEGSAGVTADVSKPIRPDPRTAAATPSRKAETDSPNKGGPERVLNPRGESSSTRTDDPTGKGADRKSPNPLKPNETGTGGPRGDEGMTQGAEVKPRKPLPGEQDIGSKGKDNPARPARKSVVTNPRLGGSVSQDAALGGANLRKGNPDARGDTDVDTKVKIGK